MFAATEESLSRRSDPSLRSGRHASFLSSDFAKTMLRFGAESEIRLSAKRRSGFGDAVEGDQPKGAGQADEQTSDPDGLWK